MCCFCASRQVDGADMELSNLFTTVLPVFHACLNGKAKIPVRHAIRNSSQRASRDALAAQRKAKRDAQSIASGNVEDEQPQTVQEKTAHHQDNQQPLEEIETTASTPARHGRARDNSKSIERGGRGR